ncbi:MAG TPA: T9SS type A sorting domain-containing protein [Hanamia sp.]
MKQFINFLLALVCLFSFKLSSAQLTSGPNLLGARGTFSVPYITVNSAADSALQSGKNSFSPIGNVGSRLQKSSRASGNMFPCSDYNYTAKVNGMQPEFTYSILRVMGDENGSNPIHSPIWQAKDHTGDGGYFLAVNGAPDITKSPIFYQIKSIPVRIGTVYEFSAWVINMMPPGGDSAASPDISFVVNGNDTIGNSGHIAYDRQWHKVGGRFIATTSTVDLKVINSTFVASGNDLGLDDISINEVQSQITVAGPAFTTEGSTVTPVFTVTDPSEMNTYCKLQVSRNSSISFRDLQTGALTYTNGVAIFKYDITDASIDLSQPNANGNVYRLVVATSPANLASPDYSIFNDYNLVVATEGLMPVKLVSFNGLYSNGLATLNWETSQEINNDHFELYRSLDGKQFDLVATIAGAGTSFVPKYYSFRDGIGAKLSDVYYRLKQVDIDGKASFSNVVRLSIGDGNESFRIYPNPVINDFTATFSASNAGAAKLLIRNVNGQTVYSQTLNILKGNNAVSVQVPQIIRGMYYVSVVNAEINFNTKMQKL